MITADGLFAKGPDGHAALVHPDDVTSPSIRGDKHVPAGFGPGSVFKPEGHCARAVCIQGIAAFQVLAPDLSTST